MRLRAHARPFLLVPVPALTPIFNPSPLPCRPAKRQRARPPVSAAPAPPAPYADALLQREYELWQRQAGMYERLQEAHDRDLERFAEERAAWQQTEAALRQEAAELRSQLLYAVAQLNALQAQVAAGGGMAGKPGAGSFPSVQPAASSTATHYPSSSQQAALAGREPAAALPSSSGSGLSGAEQVKALIDAMKPSASPASSSWAGDQPQPLSSSSSSSSAPVSPAEAWPEGAEDELPAYAADLAAAVAAVDATDVLSGLGNYSLGARRAAAAASSAAEAAAPAAAPAAVPPPQPVAQPEAQAAPAVAAPAVEEQAAADRGPPPPLTLGADDIYWVNQVHAWALHTGID